MEKRSRLKKNTLSTLKVNKVGYSFDLQHYIFIFFVGSVIGWIYEEIYFAIAFKEIVKRGFLYGPYLPVYGFGAVIIMLVIGRFHKNPMIVFLGSVFLTGLLEYITGALMLYIWNERWWDYSDLYLNINGFVCLQSVIAFGIGSLLLMYIVKPILDKYLDRIGRRNRNIACVIFCAIIILDFILTIIFRNPVR